MTTQLKILVAEDIPINQWIVRVMLEDQGHAIDLVGDGAAAVRAIAGGDGYDLVIMDIQMPVMDGVAATRAIRALEGVAASTPIIALTACATALEQQAYLSAGMNDVLSKPADSDQLREAIARVLSKRRFPRFRAVAA